MSPVPARRPGWLLDPGCKSGARGMAAQSRFLKRDGQNPAYRPSGATPVIARREALRRSMLDCFAALAMTSERLNGEAEEIGRLGVPPLALVRRQRPLGGEGAPVRPRGLHQ